MMGLNTGLVSNAAGPFGGVKQSGVGREGVGRRHRGTSHDEVHLPPSTLNSVDNVAGANTVSATIGE